MRAFRLVEWSGFRQGKRLGGGLRRLRVWVVLVMLGALAVAAPAQHAKKKPLPKKPTVGGKAPASKQAARSATGGGRSSKGKSKGKTRTSGRALTTRSAHSRASANVPRGHAETRAMDTALRPSIISRIQTALSDPDVGIEGGKYLAPFFAELKGLEAAPRSSEVRILQFGDSHTAADLFTEDLRTLFQDRFGDGGAGFSLPGRPFAGYRIHGTSRAMSGGWLELGTHLSNIGDGMVGIGGVSMETAHAGEWVSLDASGTSLRVQYLIQAGGGQIAIYDGDTLLQTIATAGDATSSAVFTTEMTPGMHHIEVRTLDDAPVRLLGLVTENPGGVTYEAMGINGAEASLFLRWSLAIAQPLMLDRQPSLIVLAYGTNEASDRNWTEPGYATMFSNVILRCRQLAPNVPILVIGPPDRAIRVGRGRHAGFQEFDGVDRIIAAQRAVCRKQGCAFWDQRRRMGGFGAMRDWTAIGWAQPDHTHFSVEGYTELAAALFSDIVRQYAAYPSTANATPNATTGSTP